MQYIQSYYTDIGIKRKSNQDSLALLKADTEYGEVLLAVLCDGMGGYQFGELASKVCVKEFARWFKNEFAALLYNGMDFERVKEDWKRIIEKCNNMLVDYGQQRGINMGSTLTAFLFVDNKYYAVQIGDSRGYVIGDSVKQITRDHSLVASEIEKGIISKEAAKTDNRTNILIECIGVTRSVNMDFYTGEVHSKDSFLLCSDGFWHRIEEEELKRYLSGSNMNDNKQMRMHLNFLVETVKGRGERDNISAIGIVPV